MKIKLNSDIRTVTKGIIAHGVNRQLAMGSGVAKSLYDKWYLVKSQYLLNSHPVPELGDIDPVVINDDLTIINGYTQEFYGTDGIVYANLYAVHLCLIFCCEYAIMKGISEIHIPRIGCDRGGLLWIDVVDALEEIETDYDIEFIVHVI